ncbi:hypothetical protein [Kribbella sindirgiensis]|uniref:Uncharacterized protein n=1 Tax=Kribbella sindirgiensis TaxID=1124744 RepID=A0A4R0IDM6_9ACTN|nr:hypothetical protein [Kribbella sindirgiensis]TCC30559.1 hypothetical protein E0H50_24455 [Kribbella sindirgiensis]
MRTLVRYGGLMAAATLTTGLLTTGTATAEQSGTTAPCTISVGSVTAGGDHRMQTFSATAPVTKVTDKIVAKDVFPDGQTRMSAAVRYGPGEGSELHTGQVVLGSVLYDFSYRTPTGGGTVSQKQLTRVGPGWDGYKTLDRSTVGSRSVEWSMRNDGYELDRRTVKTDANGRVYRHHDGWVSNFRGVKGMALISQTASYDTFLMTHTTGRLYTARLARVSGHIIPSVVKPIRMSTWQVFETLVAAPCGQGTVVLAIDRDTGNAYLYSMGHANGLSTPIKGLGKAPGTFKDPVYFSWTKFGDPPLFGE